MTEDACVFFSSFFFLRCCLPPNAGGINPSSILHFGPPLLLPLQKNDLSQHPESARRSARKLDREKGVVMEECGGDEEERARCTGCLEIRSVPLAPVHTDWRLSCALPQLGCIILILLFLSPGSLQSVPLFLIVSIIIFKFDNNNNKNPLRCC